MDAAEDHTFYVGFAMSVYQSSGDAPGQPSNWGDWETRRTLLGRSVIANGDRCGASCEFWERYDEDIQRATDLGSNCFRLSLEWSRLQPHGPGGALDADAVARYHQILDSLEARGLEPFVTLHHFVHPLWFERAGGFTTDKNIALFVDYATAAFAAFGRRARYWTTFNEPGVTSFAGFVHGSFPPGRVARIPSAGRNMLHMLRAHSQAYDAIKAMPGGDRTSVGLVHNWFTFEPKRSGCCTPFYMRLAAGLSNRLWGNDTVLTYLLTGVYDYNPFGGLGRVYYAEPRGRPGCDHFGLNYYSRGVFDWKLASAGNPGDIMTDMPYALWADGLLLAIHRISALGVPIYITETGVADAGDAVRPVMIQTYMEKVEEAVRLGYDLRGVMYWSLVDNFEWALGYGMKFGMYEFVPGGDQSRRLRPSGALLATWFARLVARCPGLAAAWRRGTEGKRPSALAPN